MCKHNAIFTILLHGCISQEPRRYNPQLAFPIHSPSPLHSAPLVLTPLQSLLAVKRPLRPATGSGSTLFPLVGSGTKPQPTDFLVFWEGQLTWQQLLHLFLNTEIPYLIQIVWLAVCNHKPILVLCSHISSLPICTTKCGIFTIQKSN